MNLILINLIYKSREGARELAVNIFQQKLNYNFETNILAVYLLTFPGP